MASARGTRPGEVPQVGRDLQDGTLFPSMLRAPACAPAPQGREPGKAGRESRGAQSKVEKSARESGGTNSISLIVPYMRR